MSADGMSLVPDYDVPPNVSPFKMLPTYTLCGHCGVPLGVLESMVAVAPDGRIHKPVCRDCFDRLTA